MKALLFGIFLFLTASCIQSSLAVARYNFETLETKLLDINEKSARSLMTFLGLMRENFIHFWVKSELTYISV